MLQLETHFNHQLLRLEWVNVDFNAPETINSFRGKAKRDSYLQASNLWGQDRLLQKSGISGGSAIFLQNLQSDLSDKYSRTTKQMFRKGDCFIDNLWNWTSYQVLSWWMQGKWESRTLEGITSTQLWQSSGWCWRNEDLCGKGLEYLMGPSGRQALECNSSTNEKGAASQRKPSCQASQAWRQSAGTQGNLRSYHAAQETTTDSCRIKCVGISVPIQVTIPNSVVVPGQPDNVAPPMWELYVPVLVFTSA